MIRVVIRLVLLAVLVYVGVYFWYGGLQKELLSGITPSKTVSGKTAAVETREMKPDRPPDSSPDFQVIVRRNIFQAELNPVQQQSMKVAEEVRPTTLNLVLLGTVVGNDRDARAIILDNILKKQDIYQIGDAVQGAFVDAIKRGRVTLRVNGRKESLLIKEREGGGPAASDTHLAAPAAGERVVRSTTKDAPPVKPHRRISFRKNTPSAEDIAPTAEGDGADDAQPVEEDDTRESETGDEP